MAEACDHSDEPSHSLEFEETRLDELLGSLEANSYMILCIGV